MNLPGDPPALILDHFVLMAVELPERVDRLEPLVRRPFAASLYVFEARDVIQDPGMPWRPDMVFPVRNPVAEPAPPAVGWPHATLQAQLRFNATVLAEKRSQRPCLRLRH